MQIIDPVTLGDVACTRASPKWVYDRSGALVQVPANTLAVTYDPSDLSKAPYALVESVATNLLTYSATLGNAAWLKNSLAGVGAGGLAGPGGTTSAYLVAEDSTNSIHELRLPAVTLNAGSTYTVSMYAKAGTRSYLRLGFSSVWGATAYAVFDLGTGTVVYTNDSVTYKIQSCGGGWYRCSTTYTVLSTAVGTCYAGFQTQPAQGGGYQADGSGNMYLTMAQLEAGAVATSYVDTAGGVGTRAADVIAAGAGLVYSNVPITEIPFSAGTSYAKGAQVYDPTTYAMYESLADANVGNALTNTGKWSPLVSTVINRRRMLDPYNNTQTTNAEEILLVVSPQAISRGLYIGNVDASEMRIAVVDQYRGVVYQEVRSLRNSTSGSSFYTWGFSRIKRRTWALSLKLPPYANALVTLCLRKPGGTARCGMFAIGPIVDLGKTLMGLGAEIKDFSETSFNFDGSSKTQIRPWAKRITADVSVDSDQVDVVYEALADYRQRPIVWVGSPNYGLSIAFGRYSSFKPVIKGATRWEMALQIEGTV